MTNSAYRGVVTILSFFVAIALLFPSVLSNFGPTTVHVFAVLYFSIFTLDANSLTLGNGERFGVLNPRHKECLSEIRVWFIVVMG